MTAFIILCFLLLLSLYFSECMMTYNDMKNYAIDITEKNVFYLKENPAYNCIITDIQRVGWETPVLTIEVQYNHEPWKILQINMTDFQNKWMKM